jgi:hypothetical protein
MSKERKIEDEGSKVTRVRASTVSTAVRNLQTWLRECLYSVVDGDDGALRFSRVVVRQLTKGNKKGEEAFSLDVPKKAQDDWCDTAALEIHAKLQNEVASLGGLQKYALYAYHSGDFENHTARFIVRLQGVSDDEDEDGLNSEGPDKTGLVSQAMRHTEASNRTMVALVQGLVGTYQSTISRLAAMNEKLLDDKLASMELIQEMQEDRDNREAKAMTAKAKAKGIQDLVGRLGILLPAVANKVAGKPIFPVEDSSMMMMVRALFTSMATNPERLDKLMAMLSPEEGIAFMNLYEQISVKDKEDKENETALTKTEGS